MKASQASQWKSVVDGLAAGEQWQWKASGTWIDIRPGDWLPFDDRANYRKKPEPRRFWVSVNNADGKVLCAWSEKELDGFRPEGNEKITMVEVVEVLK